MSTDSTNVGIVVLAAGMSKRFGGESKQLFVVDGESLVRRAARAARGSRARYAVVVLGDRAEEVRRELSRVPPIEIETVLNPDYASGQSTSVAVGVEHLQGRKPDAVLFLPCDQPWVDAQLIDRIIGTFEQAGQTLPIAPDPIALTPGLRRPVVVPTFAGRRGSPVLFPSDLLAELTGLSGDQGGRQLLERHCDRVLELELDSARPLIDIDRPTDLA